MAKDRDQSVRDREESSERSKSKLREHSESESDTTSEEEEREKKRKSSRKSEKKKRSSSSKRKSRRRHSSDEDDEDSSSSGEDSSSEESDSGSDEESREEERSRRRKRRERRRREEREREKKRRRREKEKNKKKKEKGKSGAVTNSWGKYGIIKETDMWNKRPEFTAWLAEVKQINLECLPNWEEKQMFKQFMEDHNTATFPSKKYYDLDAYYKRQREKELKKGMKKVMNTERTVFNDEEQRRQELMRERDKMKEEQVKASVRSMQGGMAQAMKEQARLKEEMAYQYKLGNFEAAVAIQRRLDPDVAM